MDGEFTAAIIVYGIIGLLIFKNRKKFTWIQGIVLAYKTLKPLTWMDKLKPQKRFWKIYSTICIPLCFYFMPQLVYMLGLNACGVITTPEASAGVALAIPGVRIPGSPIYIPLFYGVISIGILALVHEMGHGIIGKSEGIKIKSSGFGMFLIFPLFFVEPDEKSIMKSSKLSRLRMVAAGAGTNIILAFIVLSLTSYLLLPFMESISEYKGLKITSTIEGYPVSNANISTGTIITGINGLSTLNMTDFNVIIKEYQPNQTITLNTDKGNYTIVTASNPNNETMPYVGVFLENVIDYKNSSKETYGQVILVIISTLYELLIWIGFLNFSIGIMNLLPIWGLDGSNMLFNLLSYVTKEKNAKAIALLVSSASLGILVINIAPLFIKLFA